MDNYLIPVIKEEPIESQIVEDESESDESVSFTMYPIEEDTLFPPDRKPCRPVPQTYDWTNDLDYKKDKFAPVPCFHYVCIVKNTK